MMSLPMRRSSLKSSPNTLMASALWGSNTLSSTLSMIGWLNAISKPGSWSSRAVMRVIRSCLVSPAGQVL